MTELYLIREFQLLNVPKFQFNNLQDSKITIFGYNENIYRKERFENKISKDSFVLFEFPFTDETKRTVDELIEGYDAKKTDGLFYKLKKDFKLPAVLVLFDLINFKPKQIKSIDPRISTCRLGDKNSVARHSKMFEKVIESLKELDNESVLEINIVCGSYHAPCIDECLKSSTNLNNISLEMEELSSVPEISEKIQKNFGEGNKGC